MDITLFTEDESVNLTLKLEMTDKQLEYWLDNTFDNWTTVIIW